MDMRRLYEAVKEHSGLEDESIIDAGRHGADAGWGGFTYYSDSVSFYDLNEDLIWELVNEMADDFGQKPMELVASFGGAKDIYGSDQFKNLLSWFALEEVGRWLEDNPQEGTDEDEEDEAESDDEDAEPDQDATADEKDGHE